MEQGKAVKLLKEIPDDMDYPTGEEFRRAFNLWYQDNVYPFLKEIKEEENGPEASSDRSNRP